MNHVEITIAIEGQPNEQQAKVRGIVTIEQLIKNIRQEFKIHDEYPYCMWVKGTNKPLDSKDTISALYSGQTTRLVFGRTPPQPQQIVLNPDWLESENSKQLTTRDRGMALYDAITSELFKIIFTPMIIGRSADTRYPKLARLAINEARHANANLVSRDHAVIFSRGGSFYIADLPNYGTSGRNNPTYLNNDIVQENVAYPLHLHDKIRLGETHVTLELVQI